MLKRYRKVTKGLLLPVYRICQAIGIRSKSFAKLDLKELWKLHSEGLQEFRLLKAEVDAKRKKNLSVAKPSLLDLKAEIAKRLLEDCVFCERYCRVNRQRDKLGYCQVSKKSLYSSEFINFAVEPQLSPTHTIFFTGCSFRCVYCRNWDIVENPENGVEVSMDISEVISERKAQGAKNVTLVGGSPEPHIYTILQLLKNCQVDVPLMWDSNVYWSQEAMELLEGIIDLFIINLRYGNDTCARKYSDVPNYCQIVDRNFRQAAEVSEVLVRHLVLPSHFRCCTKFIVPWVTKRVNKAYFTLELQYLPCHRAREYPEIWRRLNKQEQMEALKLLREHKEKLRLNVY